MKATRPVIDSESKVIGVVSETDLPTIGVARPRGFHPEVAERMAVGRRRTDPTEVAPSLAEGFDGDGHGDSRTRCALEGAVPGQCRLPLAAHRPRGGDPDVLRPLPVWIRSGGNPRRATTAARVRRVWER